MYIVSSITSIAANAFGKCSSLNTVYWNAVECASSESNYSRFYGCTKLTDLIIGNHVCNIPSYAFRDCSSLKNVTIGTSVTSIGNQAFYNCRSLTRVNYLGNISDWCGISGLYNIMAYGSDNIKSYINNEEMTGELVIPDGITSISGAAFYNCSSLTSIVIPDSVISIGMYAFSGCSSLESMTVPFVGCSIKTSSDTYQYPFGAIFGEREYIGGVSTTQYYYGSSTSSSGETCSTYYVPASLKSVIVTGGNILRGAFYNCSGLTSIIIPDGVTTVGAYAFNKSGLTSITIPDGVISIGYRAFYECSELVSITISNNIKSINEGAFQYCKNLISITFNGTKEEWSLIAKGYMWNNVTGNYTIHCLDQDISKSES